MIIHFHVPGRAVEDTASPLPPAIHAGGKGAICHAYIQRITCAYLTHATNHAPIRARNDGKAAAQHSHRVERVQALFQTHQTRPA